MTYNLHLIMATRSLALKPHLLAFVFKKKHNKKKSKVNEPCLADNTNLTREINNQMMPEMDNY